MYTYQRGEDVRVMLEAVGTEADDLADIEVAASLKRAKWNKAPPESEPAVAAFVVDPAEAEGDVGAGWHLTIPTVDLVPGVYATNAVLTFPGGAVEKTETLLIRIEEAV